MVPISDMAHPHKDIRDIHVNSHDPDGVRCPSVLRACFGRLPPLAQTRYGVRARKVAQLFASTKGPSPPRNKLGCHKT